MKTNFLLITLALFAGLLLAGCSSRARVGALRTESQSVEQGEAESVRVEIVMGAGMVGPPARTTAPNYRKLNIHEANQYRDK